MKIFRSFVKMLGRLQYRFFNRMRHRKAFDIARQPPSATNFDGLEGHHYCLAVTFKRSGEPVPTPLQFGLLDGNLYFRSETDVAKIARIRNDPRVCIAPCNWRGKPLGPLASGKARVVSATEEALAHATLKSNYTFSQRLFEGMVDHLPIEMTYVEVVPTGKGPRAGAG